MAPNVVDEEATGGFGGRAKHSSMARWWDMKTDAMCGSDLKMQTSVWVRSESACSCLDHRVPGNPEKVLLPDQIVGRRLDCVFNPNRTARMAPTATVLAVGMFMCNAFATILYSVSDAGGGSPLFTHRS